MPDKNNSKPEEEFSDDDIIFEETEEFTKESTNEIKKVKAKLKKALEEKQEYLNGWQRSQAESINLKKRLEEDKKNFTAYANENFIMELIPVLDSFDMAFTDKDAWEKAPENWRKGIEYIYTQFTNTLENNGVKIIDPVGQNFNHDEHNSVESVPGDEGKIIKVLQKGYKLKDKMIRPASVTVGNGN